MNRVLPPALQRLVDDAKVVFTVARLEAADHARYAPREAVLHYRAREFVEHIGRSAYALASVREEYDLTMDMIRTEAKLVMMSTAELDTLLVRAYEAGRSGR